MFFFIEGDAPDNKPAFESIKHIDEDGREYWTARELQTALGYKKWEKFSNIIEKAKEACEGSDNAVSDHFPQVGKMVKSKRDKLSDHVPQVGNMINAKQDKVSHHFADVRKMIEAGKGAQREMDDYHLSRYACYLIAMNGDPRKKEIALAQSYFAIKTRQQELAEQYDAKRLAVRREMAAHNKSLADAAYNAGVQTSRDFGVFQNHGYEGLYGGLNAKQIHARKGLKKSQQILDHMGTTELAANLFRATQTEEKLRRENIQGKENANKTHFDVGREVRDTIKRLGGTMPENLPTPDKSVREIGQSQKKRLPKKGDEP